MPIYEYRCHDCGATSEFLIGTAGNETIHCRNCGSLNQERLMSAASFVGPAHKWPAAIHAADVKNAVKRLLAPQGVAAIGIERACEHRQDPQGSNKPATLAGNCEQQFKDLTTG